jgi:DNA-binding transcriptional MocR family regulator
MKIWDILRPSGPGPKYRIICDLLAGAIERGELEHGRPLPSHRSLAAHLGVSVGTVTRAYEEAIKRGLIEGEVGRGTFVRHGVPMPLTVVDASRIPAGCLDLYQNFPVAVPEVEHAAWAEALSVLGARPDLSEMCRKSWSEVSERSRRAGRTWMQRVGFDPPLHTVFECPGTQPMLVTLVNATTQPGDVVLAPSLSHPAIRLISEQHGLKLQGLPMDDAGIVPDAFEEACREHSPRLIYVPPTIHSPTTVTFSDERRREIARIAVQHDVVILEDESAAFLMEQPPTPIVAHAPTHTFFVADVWMALSLGLRTTYVSVPQRFVTGVSKAVAATCGVSAPLLTEVAAIWIQTGIADRLIEARQAELHERHALALDVLRRRDVRADPAGHHLWILLPPPWHADLFVARAERLGVAINGADWFFVGGDVRPQGVRVCLGNVKRHDRLRDALERLDSLIGQPDATRPHAAI